MPFLKCNSKELPRSQLLVKNINKNGWRHAIFNSNGDKYVGNWDNNKENGFGVLINKFGKLYEGNWAHGYKHKFGSSAKSDYCNVFIRDYLGEWRCGDYYLKGEKHYKDGGFFKGEFRKNKREGNGMMWYPDGSFYHGNWENDLKHGDGVYVLANGNIYVGKFEKGMKQGRGKYYHFKTGQLQEGIWLQDVCVISLLEDIPYRQTALNPTKYPIPEIEVVDYENVYRTEEDIWESRIEQLDTTTNLSSSTV